MRATRRAGDELVVVLEDATELRRLQQIRTEFIDNLSHELRTPLSTVSLLAETLAREPSAPTSRSGCASGSRKIEVETGHLVQMVSELLDLARIEGGSQLRLEDDVDLGRLADASAERLRLFAERQGVTIAVDVGARDADDPRRRGAAGAGVHQPRPQRREVQPGRRRGPGRGPPSRATTRSPR